MFGRIIRGNSVEDCVDHYVLQEQIDELKKEVGILKCKEHEYSKQCDIDDGVIAKCDKCGRVVEMTQLGFAEHRMLFADADHKVLSDEIKRLKDCEKTMKMVSASLNGKTKEK